MSTAKRQTLADFMYYSLCEGQSKAGPYGYSPLPLNLVQAGFEQVRQLATADPAVDLTNRDVTRCNNPTFDGKNPSKNVLAEIAPQPATCDKQGEGPCGTETGTGEPSTDDPDAPTTEETTGGKKGDKTAETPSTAPDPGGTPTTGTAIDPVTGEAVNPPAGATVEGVSDTGTVAGNEPLYATPTELSAERPMDSKAFGWLAVIELLALILVPGILISRRAARNGAAR
jgi:hypothetical protein